MAIGIGAIIPILIPFLFNSASYKGKLNLPLRNVSAKLRLVPEGTATPKPFSPSQDIVLFPARTSRASKILSAVAF